MAVTDGGENARSYVNGAQVEEASSSMKPSEIEPVLNLLGMGQAGSEPLFMGRIDEFRVYNHVLDAVDVEALAGLAPPRPPQGIAASVVGAEVSLVWSSTPGATQYRVMGSASLEGHSARSLCSRWWKAPASTGRGV